jgi:hypothetical protein
VYEILFPGAPLPRSPYIEPELSEALSEFQDFCTRERATLVRQYVESQLPEVLRPHEDEILAFSQGLEEECNEILVRAYEERYGGREDEISQSSPTEVDPRNPSPHSMPGLATSGSSMDDLAASPNGVARSHELGMQQSPSQPPSLELDHSNGSDNSSSMGFSSIQLNGLAPSEAMMNPALIEKAVLDQPTLFALLMNGSLSYESYIDLL